MRIGRSYSFAAAHHLPNVPPGHKCGTVHGHTYSLDVELYGTPHEELGWLLDFSELDRVVGVLVIRELDHKDINTVVANPTTELLVDWIFGRLSAHTWGGDIALCRVRLAESTYSWAERET